MSLEHIHLPHFLIESLQTICQRQDSQFIRDVSRLIKIPERDIRVKIIGSRGVSVPILCESQPWWTGGQCTMSECKNGSLWIRCGAMAIEDGMCTEHRNTRETVTLLRYDASELKSLARRRPVLFNGETFWASDVGDIVNSLGEVVPLTMNWETGVLDATLYGTDTVKN